MDCLTCTPTDILVIEACLPTLSLLLTYKKRLANLFVPCSHPEINPATVQLPPSVQTPSLYRHPTDHQVLLAKNSGSRLLLLWRQPKHPSKNRVHLPMNAVPLSMLFLVATDRVAPLPVISDHLLAEFYPDYLEGNSYTQLKQRCLNRLREEWEVLAHDQAWYLYRTPLNPPPFMGLHKFNTQSLSLIRSRKSYLHAHLSWDNNDISKNNTWRSVRSVHLTHLMQERKSRIQTKRHIDIAS